MEGVGQQRQIPVNPDYDRDFRLKQAAEKEYYANACPPPQRPMSDEEILAELFRYHPPTPNTTPKFQAINLAAKNFAEVILANCPRGADRFHAIRKIREARMLANAAISLNGLELI